VYRLTAIEDDEDPTPAIAAYTYNDAGEVTRLDLKNGTYGEYTYDEVGRLETLVNSSPGNWVISSCRYARNKVGCPTQLTYQDGRYRDYAYDDVYRLTREEHVDPWDTTIAWHGYAYDAAGNRAEKEYDGAGSGNKYTYTNNNMNQLTTLTATGTPGHKTDVAGTVTDENVASVTVYNDTLDPVGEFEAALRQTFFIARGVELDEGTNDLYAVAQDKTGSESRDPATGYHVVTLDDPPDPSLTYVYDDNGCLVEIKEGATTLKEYIYDYENRLVEVKHGGTPVAAFEYDGLGRRIKSTVGSVVTRFVYDGDAVLEEYAWDTQGSSWVLAAVYVHGIGIDNTLSIERGGNVYYYHYDGYGSVSELTDEDGALAQAYEYDAWGIATIYDPESAIENPYLYTGRRWDAAIALYYYRARHYAPTLGRFLQPDPIGYGDSTNLYVYVSGTPTVFIDPAGMEEIVRKKDKVYWYVEKPSWTGIGDATVEKRLIGHTKDGWVVLSDEYGGGTLKLDTARTIAANTEYLGKSVDGKRTVSDDTVAGSIERALHGSHGGDRERTANPFQAATKSVLTEVAAMGVHSVRMSVDPVHAANTIGDFYKEAVQVEQQTGGIYDRWSYMAGRAIGITGAVETAYGFDFASGEELHGADRWGRGLTSAGQLTLTVVVPTLKVTGVNPTLSGRAATTAAQATAGEAGGAGGGQPVRGFRGSQGPNPYHGLDQVIERGVNPQAILKTVKNPTVAVTQGGGRTLYLTREAAVVLNSEGQVVTSWGAAQHTAKTLNLLRSAGGP